MPDVAGKYVTISMPNGINFLTRRREAYAHLGDLLDAIEALKVGGRDAGYDTFLLEKFAEMLGQSYARAR